MCALAVYLAAAISLHSVVLKTLFLRTSVEGRGVLEHVPTSVADPVLICSKQMKKRLENKPFPTS
jgi:hypothetical protein